MVSDPGGDDGSTPALKGEETARQLDIDRARSLTVERQESFSQFCAARVRWWVGSGLDGDVSLACTCEEADVSDPCSGEWGDLPLMLTVEDASRVLRIGRSHAYNLTKVYFASGGTDGLPALRLGDLLRVPKAALYELVSTGRVVQLIPSRVADATPGATARKTSRPGRRADRTQLSLLGSD